MKEDRRQIQNMKEDSRQIQNMKEDEMTKQGGVNIVY